MYNVGWSHSLLKLLRKSEMNEHSEGSDREKENRIERQERDRENENQPDNIETTDWPNANTRQNKFEMIK